MKLKKLLAMLLALAMVFAFAACEKDDDDDSDEKESKKKASDTVKEDEDEADTKKESKKSDDDDIDTPIEEEDGEEISGSKKTERKLPGGSSGKSSNVAPGQAEWEGYEGMAFADMFAKGITGANSDIDLSMSITMGWSSDSLDENDVDDPWTFEFEMENDGETAYIIFYMAMEDGVLVAHGADVISPDGTAESGNAAEAEELINMFAEYI